MNSHSRRNRLLCGVLATAVASLAAWWWFPRSLEHRVSKVAWEVAVTDRETKHGVERVIISVILIGPEITDSDLEVLKECEHLETITLIDTNVSGKGLSELSVLPSLRCVLWKGHVTNADLPWLRSLPHLRCLSIESPALNDESTTEIVQIGTLRGVDLVSPQLTDESAALLAQQHELIVVGLGKSQLSNDGFRLLLTMPKMGMLGIAETNVSEKAIEQARNEHPHLDFLYKNTSFLPQWSRGPPLWVK